MRLKLKPKYKELSNQYNEMLQTRGCSCHINAPCGVCTHEGHPLNLDGNDDAWVKVLKIPQEEIKRRFDYDESSGNLLHKIPRQKRFIGLRAGGLSNCGYMTVQVGKSVFRLHRLIWIYHFGDIPDGYWVDHIDGNPLNNKIENLRLATNQENSINTKLSKANKVGYKGVSRCNRTNKWRAQAMLNGVYHSLGYRDTPEDAHELYKAFVKANHGEFLHHAMKD